MRDVQPHPGLNLSLTFTDATTDLLQDDVDIAIRFGALADSPHLVARPLAKLARVLCTSPAYVRAYGEPLTLKDIAKHRCIVGQLKGPPMVWFVNEGGAEMKISPPSINQLSDAEAMVEAVVSGLGIAQFPISLVRTQLNDGRLQPVLQAYAPSGVDIHLLWPKRAQLSPRVRYIVGQLLAFAAQGRFD